MIDVYQATTQMTDESGQTFPKNPDVLLDNAINLGYYGAFTANMHTDFNPSNSSISSVAIVNSAKNRNIPVISAQPDARLARRPQRLDLPVDRVERQRAVVHDRRRRRRERAPGDGAAGRQRVRRGERHHA